MFSLIDTRLRNVFLLNPNKHKLANVCVCVCASFRTYIVLEAAIAMYDDDMLCMAVAVHMIASLYSIHRFVR